MNNRKESIFFSVIIPVYNKEKHIRRCINSVLNQNYTSYEIVIVNDSSTDKSLDEINQFSNSNIIVLSRKEPGPGGYAARNLGALKANGDWLTFLDADDEWLENHLSSISNIINNNSEAKVVSTSWYISKKNSRLRKCRFSVDNSLPQAGVMSFAQFLDAGAKFMLPMHTNTIGIKKDLFDLSGGFPAGLFMRGGDVSTWLKLVSLSGYLYYTKAATAVYHLENSTVAANTPSILQSAILWQTNILLKDCNSYFNRLKLKKFANTYTSYIYLKKLKNGNLNYNDTNYFFYEANLLRYIFIIILSIFPSQLQILTFKLIKHTFS
tara:strand:+ start:92416 stop:93384 length:969 start_codon:yes stop_codon:yes gene_type:complete